MIESYDFGRMVIDGNLYTSDLIVHPGGVRDRWWRREGHSLAVEDIEEALRPPPEVLVVGTGFSGLMEVPGATLRFLEDRGIEVRIESTGRAWKTYNELKGKGRRVVAAFHLTC